MKKIKANIDSWKTILIMAIAKEKAIYERVKKIKKLLKNNLPIADQGFGGFGFQLDSNNLLLNQYELDMREKFKEIINEFPFVAPQKKIFEKNTTKNSKTIANINEKGLEKSPEQKISKRTIEIDFKLLSDREQLPNIQSAKNSQN